MKKKIVEIEIEKDRGLKGKKITRKEAFKKAGYIAVTAATTMILLSNPNKAQATSAAPPTPW
ncbi:MAG TPA: hypothetical protein VGK38_01465 [Prolixibacteraceae bacterium]|jgi:hypothetical protein